MKNSTTSRGVSDGLLCLATDVSSDHSQQKQRALKSIDVRFAPKVTVSHPTAIRRKGPQADLCSAIQKMLPTRIFGASLTLLDYGRRC
jgi:hypothetical protein